VSNVPEQTDRMVTAGCYEAGTRCRGRELRIKNCPANLATCRCIRYVFSLLGWFLEKCGGVVGLN
jgi:hypothetical protein